MAGYIEDITSGGETKFGPDASTPADLGTGSFEGQLRYVVSEDNYYYWDGSQWVLIDSSNSPIDAGTEPGKLRLIQLYRSGAPTPGSVPASLAYGEIFIDVDGTVYVGDQAGTPIPITGGGGSSNLILPTGWTAEVVDSRATDGKVWLVIRSDTNQSFNVELGYAEGTGPTEWLVTFNATEGW